MAKVLLTLPIRNSENVLTANTSPRLEVFPSFSYATNTASGASVALTVEDGSLFASGDTIYLAENDSTSITVSGNNITLVDAMLWSEDDPVVIKTRSAANVRSTLYSDSKFTNTISYPFVGDSENEWGFFIPSGEYAVRYSNSVDETLQMDHGIHLGGPTEIVHTPDPNSTTKGIQEAIDRLPSNTGTLILNGSFVLDSFASVTISGKTGITIKGGPDTIISTTDVGNTSNYDPFFDVTTASDQITFDGLRFEGPSGGTFREPIRVDGSVNCVVQNCYAKEMGTFEFRGSGGDRLKFINNTVIGSGKQFGIAIATYLGAGQPAANEDVIISGNTFTDAYFTSIQVETRPERLIITNNTCTDSNQSADDFLDGIRVQNGADELVISNNVVSGTVGASSTSLGFGNGISIALGEELHTPQKWTITGNVIEDCGSPLGDATGSGIFIDTGNAANPSDFLYGTISGNTINNNARDGILIQGDVRGITIVGNQLNSNGNWGILAIAGATLEPSEIVITGNYIYNNSSGGVAVVGDHHNITGNTCYFNGGEGIQLSKDTFDCVINNNIIKDNSQATPGFFDGIRIRGEAGTGGSRNLVMGNVITGSDHAYGVHVEGSASTSNRIIHNTLTGMGTGGILDSGTTTFMRGNEGHVTENSGAITLVNPNTVVPVTHGCDFTPANGEVWAVAISQRDGITTPWFFVDNPTSTTFDLTVDNTPTSGIIFNWFARRK